jgi:hypothetical protein
MRADKRRDTNPVFHDMGIRRDRVPPAVRLAISGQEFAAVCLAATPKHFALLARRMIRHKRQYEHVPDIERGICRDLGAARRDVQYEAFELRYPVVDRNPGRLFAQLPSRLALYLGPWLVKRHDNHPSLGLTAIGQPIAKTGHRIEGDFCKIPVSVLR